jgi:hypothetical protein
MLSDGTHMSHTLVKEGVSSVKTREVIARLCTPRVGGFRKQFSHRPHGNSMYLKMANVG